MPSLLHEFFEEAAGRWPDRVAIEVPPGSGRPGRQTITYADLQNRVKALSRKIGPLLSGEKVVVVLLPRTTEYLALAQLAILTAGGAHACCDTSFPDEQIRIVLEDSAATILLTDRSGVERAHRAGWTVPYLFDITAPSTYSLPEAFWSEPETTARHLAYLIYTSGTTGKPKGVMIEHAAIVNLVQSDIAEFGLAPGDRVVQGSSPAYDSSVEETWLALASGATLVLADEETTRLGPDLVPWLQRERITVFCPPPTLLRATGCPNPAEVLPDLRLLYVGGEALPADLVERWGPGRRLVNGYGPTECSVTALRCPITSAQSIPIGRPISGMTACVLDADLEPLPDGQLGELCLGGMGLARGYHLLPDLTLAKFPIHPTLGRIYRTGDLVSRDSSGTYHYHGRLDAQVKWRGYRIELEAIEARISELPGVRAVACTVQSGEEVDVLVAFVVPQNEAERVSLQDLRTHLQKALPGYMVPTRLGFLPELPTGHSGKLDRRALPILTHDQPIDRGSEAPLSTKETQVAEAMRQALGMTTIPERHAHFFHDLGGDSLLAAGVISLLRTHPETESLTVRDIYEAPTCAGLAQRARGVDPGPPPSAPGEPRSVASPGWVTLAQGLFLLAEFLTGSFLVYWATFFLFPISLEWFGLMGLIALGPPLLVGGLGVYGLASLGLVLGAKKVLIGRYRPLCAPAWGEFYLRNWIVQHLVRLVPWGLIEGTVFHHWGLRALGARIGRRVHLSRGVDLLRGGWDLLTIEDDVSIGRDAALRLAELSDGQIHVGPITLRTGSRLDTRAGMSPGSLLERDATLGPLSWLPPGQHIPERAHWSGVPAGPTEASSPSLAIPKDHPPLTQLGHGVALLAARACVGQLRLLPFQIVLALIFLLIAPEIGSFSGLRPGYEVELSAKAAAMAVACLFLVLPLRLILDALLIRALGTIRPGVLSVWSYQAIRIHLKIVLVESAGNWLSGTLLWPHWLRLAGMQVGEGCEISTIMETIPELTNLGKESFLADGIYLGGPRALRGVMEVIPVVLGSNTFLGNHTVIPGGTTLPEDILLGVCTVADPGRIRPGTSWFGMPLFELPRRVEPTDRRLTHHPSWIRYINRQFWELLRFTLPFPALAGLIGWYLAACWADTVFSFEVVFFVILPVLNFSLALTSCLAILALKWFLLGRVRPGQHPLWSCWCSRWDFHYVAWGLYAQGPLSAFEGTLFLAWYLRAMGARIGKRVVLGAGFAHVVDPDMLHFEDGATVNALFQAHTFEDRVLKIDYISLGRLATVGGGSVLLYGSHIGERCYVAPHSVVMKGERLLAGRKYEGCPTREQESNSPSKATSEKA